MRLLYTSNQSNSDTLAKNAIEYIVNHASVSVIVCNKEVLPEVIKAQKVCPCLKYIILMDLQSADQEWIQSNNKQQAGYTHTISELLAFGQQNSNNLEPDRYAKPDDHCTICYTSGTTGNLYPTFFPFKILDINIFINIQVTQKVYY